MISVQFDGQFDSIPADLEMQVEISTTVKKFRFTLESAMEWSRRKLEAEQTELQRLLGELRNIEGAIEQLKSNWRAEQESVRNRGGLEGQDLWRLAEYEAWVRQQEASLMRRLEETHQAACAQQERYIEAKRKMSLFEKLKESRMADWQKECDQQLEALATEVFLSRQALRKR